MKKLLVLLLLPVAAFAEEGYSPKIVAQPLMRTTTTSADQPIVYPKVEQPEVTALMVLIPPGAETGWHKHPYPAYGYILEGELDVEVEGKGVRHYKAGEALAETVNLLHNGKNNGTKVVRLVMFVTGEKGQPFTVKGEKP